MYQYTCECIFPSRHSTVACSGLTSSDHIPSSRAVRHNPPNSSRGNSCVSTRIIRVFSGLTKWPLLPCESWSHAKGASVCIGVPLAHPKDSKNKLNRFSFRPAEGDVYTVNVHHRKICVTCEQSDPVHTLQHLSPLLSALPLGLLLFSPSPFYLLWVYSTWLSKYISE